MAKEDLNLDEELKNNLDFLDDNELNAAPANNYLAPKSSIDVHKAKLFAIITVVAILVIVIIMHLNKQHHKHHNQLITLPDKPAVVATQDNKISNPQYKIHQDKLPQAEPQHHAEQAAPTAPVADSHHVADLRIDAAIRDNHSNVGSVNPHSVPAVPNKHSEEHHVTWQDLKKAVTVQETPVPTPTKTQVEGFEHQTKELVQQQIQQHAQENINELKLNIDNITKELSLNANQIRELQNNLKEISRSIGSVDTKILNLTNTIDTLSSNVKKYTQDEDLDLIANIKPSESDLFVNNGTKNTPEYIVHAVIPGRAWLKSTAGQIITVAEGDVLGDYGKIALIDAANNLVRTSSGVIFR